jgi:uncharacterized membrane protein YeaQ/YmgE (transglycosylase-associated protein family)
MGLLLWIIMGALAGWIASILMGTDAQQGAVMNIVLGILGAIAGGFLAGMFGYPGVTGFNIYSLVIATLGAVALIWVRRALVRA